MSRDDLDDDDEITGINVAPMVDIMLVLLVIFMVTSSFIVNKSIKVELPEAAHSESSAQESVLNFAINAEKELYLNDKKISFDSIEGDIKELIQKQGRQPENIKLSALISADQSVNHGMVVKLIDFIRRSGIEEFALDVKEPAK